MASGNRGRCDRVSRWSTATAPVNPAVPGISKLSAQDKTTSSARLTALIEGADAARLEEMRRDIYEVLAWIVDEDAHTLRGISRAGWPSGKFSAVKL